MSNLLNETNLSRGFSLRNLAGFAISGALLWITLSKSGLDLKDVRMTPNQVNYFIAAMAVFVFSLWLYSLRAQLIWIGRGNGQKKYHTYFSLIVGNFYNCILPGNLGEGVRAWHFSKKNGVTFSASLAGIITEKWLDAQVFAILVGGFFLLQSPKPSYITRALGITALAVAILTVIQCLMLKFQKLEKDLLRLVLYIKIVGKFLYRLYLNTNWHLSHMKFRKANYGFVVFFGLIFSLNMLQFYLLEKAAGLEEPIAGFYSSFLVSISIMIIAFIPSAPSNIGVLHYGVYSVLLYSCNSLNVVPTELMLKEFALFSIYVHLSFLLPEIILGLIALIKEKNNLF
jgi:uncharacterized protein (TIRG00374 family)